MVRVGVLGQREQLKQLNLVESLAGSRKWIRYMYMALYSEMITTVN